jgi:putative serine protease PepD
MSEHEGWAVAPPHEARAESWPSTARAYEPRYDAPSYEPQPSYEPTLSYAPQPSYEPTASHASQTHYEPMPSYAPQSTYHAGHGMGAGFSSGSGFPNDAGFTSNSGLHSGGQLPRRPRRIGVTLLTVFAMVVLAGGSALAGGYAALRLQPAQTQTAAAVVRGASTAAGNQANLADVATAVLPAVVTITTGTGSGSGVVISADGAILTNNHVVASGRGAAVQVTFSTGKSARATVVGTDAANDLAVIKVAGMTGLTALRFADSDGVRAGDAVLAVGSPLGLDGSVTAGIVSALHRTIDEGSQTRSGASTSIPDALQTDAAINPGNSGGALVNSAGELIGINTAIATSGSGSGNIGVGFAISSNTAKKVATRLLGS